MENKSLRKDIDCILENYEQEVKALIHEANSLYNKIEKSKSSIDCNYYFKRINAIDKKHKAIEQCYKDCIIDL